MALGDFAAFDLRFVAFVHSDAWALHLVDFASEYELLGIIPLSVDAHHPALSDVVVCHLNFAFFISNRKHSSGFEVSELAGGNDHIGVDEETTCCEVVVVASELTGDQVHSGLWQRHKAGDLLLEVLGQGSVNGLN